MYTHACSDERTGDALRLGAASQKRSRQQRHASRHAPEPHMRKHRACSGCVVKCLYRLYIGSISASPTACPLRGYGRAGTQKMTASERRSFCLGHFVAVSLGAAASVARGAAVCSPACAHMRARACMEASAGDGIANIRFRCYQPAVCSPACALFLATFRGMPTADAEG